MNFLLNKKVRTILVLASNISTANVLRSDLENQSVGANLKHPAFNTIFKCPQPSTLLDVLEGERPEIVHFCGHGTEEGLVLASQSEDKPPILVRTQALRLVFERVSSHVNCVFLNACYSKAHAEAISEYVTYAIGMEGDISDIAAINFATEFYKELGKGKSIEDAFNRLLVVSEIHGYEKPKLFKKKQPNVLQNFCRYINRIISDKANLTDLGNSNINNLVPQLLLLLLCFSCLAMITTLFALSRSNQVISIAPKVEITPKPTELPCGEPVTQIEQPPQISSPDQERELFSSGEKVILTYKNNHKLIGKGSDAFKEEKYDLAYDLFQKAIDSDPNNPEAYIYKNNAKARLNAKENELKIYTLAAVIPSGSEKLKTRAEEMMRGIADAQKCFNDVNQKNCPHDTKVNLEVRLFEDAVDPADAQKVAKKIVADSKILGVIGHYTSAATEDALPAYGRGQLAIVSPSSTISSLKNTVFFRTVFSSDVLSKKLTDYIKEQKNITKVIGFVDSSDPLSSRLWNDFQLSLRGRMKIKKIEINNKLDIENAINFIKSGKGFATVLIPPSAKSNYMTEIEGFDKASQIAKRISGSSENIIIGASSLYNHKVLDSSFKDLVLVVPWFAKASASKGYAEAARRTWHGQISWVTARSYDATQSFMQALLSMNTSLPDDKIRSNLIDALKHVNLPPEYTSGSRLKFNDDHEVAGAASLVKVVQGNFCSPVQEGFAFQLISDSD